MIVTLPDGQDLDFPDEATPDQMRKYVTKNYPQHASLLQKDPPAPTQGFGGIVQDIKKSLTGLPTATGKFASALPGEANAAFSQLYQNPSHLLGNLLVGGMEGVRGAINTPSNLANYLKSKGIGQGSIEDLLGKARLPDGQTQFEKSIAGPEQKGDALVQGLASFAPYGAIGGVERGLKGLLGRTGAAGAYGVGQNQDPLQTALMGLTGELGGKAIGKGVNSALNPAETLKNIKDVPTDMAAKIFRGKLSPEELSSNLRAAQGTNTSLGRVLENPSLNTLFEKVTSQTPFSGGSGILDNIKKQIQDKANSVVESLAPPDANGDLNNLQHSLLNNAFENQRNIKNKIYTKRNEIAEKEGLELQLPKFESLAKKTTKSIEESPLYTDDPKFRNQYNQLMGYKNTTQEIPGKKSKILDQNGKPVESESSRTIRPSLTEAQVTAGDLYTRGDKLQKSPDPKSQILGNNLKNMSSALRQDINDNIKKGSPELQAAHEKANTNYAENYSPFLDEDVFDKIKEKEPQTLIHQIIQPGKTKDKFRDIEKINNLLPDDQKNILGYAYLKGAEEKSAEGVGNLNPKKVAALINALGNRQFKALYPEEKTRQMLLDYGNARGMNEKALNVMHNPETGAKAIPLIQMMAAMSSPTSAIAGTAGSYLANKLLTSPSLRENLINKMIENSKKNISKIPKTKSSLSSALRQALTASQRGYQQQSNGKGNE